MLRTFRGGLLIGLAVAVAVAAGAIAYERHDTKTLKRTVKRGEVLCGVNKGLPGFSIPDDKGDWTGFDVDFCRAMAAAIFDDPKKVKFLPLDANERFKELQSRKVDILSRNSTWSMSRETNYDLYFPAVAYYDGQGSCCRVRASSSLGRPTLNSPRALLGPFGGRCVLRLYHRGRTSNPDRLMCDIPLDLERRFEQRWAARFARPVPPKKQELEGQDQQAAASAEIQKRNQPGRSGQIA